MLISGSMIVRRPLPLRWDVLIVCTVCGVLGSVIPGTAYFYAASRLSPGVLSITIATVPLMTFLAAAILGVERVSTTRLLGVFLGILSIGLLIGPSTSLPDRSAIPWILLAVGAGLCYTAENLFVSMRMPTDINVYTLVGGMFLVATIVMTPLVIMTGTFEPLLSPLERAEWAMRLYASEKSYFEMKIFVVGC